MHINGTYRGVTPLSISLAAGTHNVQLYMGGVPRWQNDIDVPARGTRIVQVTIQ